MRLTVPPAIKGALRQEPAAVLSQVPVTLSCEHILAFFSDSSTKHLHFNVFAWVNNKKSLGMAAKTICHFFILCAVGFVFYKSAIKAKRSFPCLEDERRCGHSHLL